MISPFLFSHGTRYPDKTDHYNLEVHVPNERGQNVIIIKEHIVPDGNGGYDIF